MQNTNRKAVCICEDSARSVRSFSFYCSFCSSKVRRPLTNYPSFGNRSCRQSSKWMQNTIIMGDPLFRINSSTIKSWYYPDQAIVYTKHDMNTHVEWYILHGVITTIVEARIFFRWGRSFYTTLYYKCSISFRHNGMSSVLENIYTALFSTLNATI